MPRKMPGRRSKREGEEDREARIRKLKKKVEAISGEPMATYRADDMPLEIEEQFWKHVLDFETATPVSLFEALVNGGVTLPPPDQLDDAQLPAKLKELFNAMSLLGAYLHSTDHLSDRELYEHLWNESLREPAFLQPNDPDFGYHIDLVGSGSEEDTALYLKYYADEEERRRWMKEFPEDSVPEHVDPPFNRDRHLPKHEPHRPARSSGGTNEKARRGSRKPPAERPC